ncbi:hypothetical protein ACQ86N_15360 [Puia sp. P3]|uniref:hypothetical protein n=1 Tax=Puia sp. P3 TaxID=3423952 RepID=UPI003D67392B
MLAGSADPSLPVSSITIIGFKCIRWLAITRPLSISIWFCRTTFRKQDASCSKSRCVGISSFEG